MHFPYPSSDKIKPKYNQDTLNNLAWHVDGHFQFFSLAFYFLIH